MSGTTWLGERNHKRKAGEMEDAREKKRARTDEAHSLKVETLDKKWRCPLSECNCVYTRKGDLKFHFKQKHQDNMELLYSAYPMLKRNRSTKSNKTYVCPLPSCPCGYGRLCDLKNHFVLRHPNRLEDFPDLRPSKVFECGICNTKFARNQVLHRHLIKVHNKVSGSSWESYNIKHCDDEEDNSSCGINNTSSKEDEESNTSFENSQMELSQRCDSSTDQPLSPSKQQETLYGQKVEERDSKSSTKVDSSQFTQLNQSPACETQVQHYVGKEENHSTYLIATSSPQSTIRQQNQSCNGKNESSKFNLSFLVSTQPKVEAKSFSPVLLQHCSQQTQIKSGKPFEWFSRKRYLLV